MANKALLLSFSLTQSGLQSSPPMASTSTLQAPYSLSLKPQNVTHLLHDSRAATTRASSRRRSYSGAGVFAATTGPSKPQRPPPGVDTRIHWDNEDEGWIGESSNSRQTKEKLNPEEEQKSLLGEKFADLLNDSSDSHYQWVFYFISSFLPQVAKIPWHSIIDPVRKITWIQESKHSSAIHGL